jgi:hypothetical protein
LERNSNSDRATYNLDIAFRRNSHQTFIRKREPEIVKTQKNIKTKN